MTTDAHRIKLLKELLAERILVLDGAFGTFVLGENLSAADYGGARYEGCNENVVRTRPDLIRRMHTGFLEVGADIIETASFQASPIVLAEYGLEPETRHVLGAGVAAGQDHLQRHGALQGQVSCLVDHTHAAPAQHALDRVTRHGGRWLGASCADLLPQFVRPAA